MKLKLQSFNFKANFELIDERRGFFHSIKLSFLPLCLKNLNILMYKTHPFFWCLILGQKSVSYTWDSTVCLQLHVPPGSCWNCTSLLKFPSDRMSLAWIPQNTKPLPHVFLPSQSPHPGTSILDTQNTKGLQKSLKSLAGLAHMSSPFPTCPNYHIHDTGTIWSLVLALCVQLSFLEDWPAWQLRHCIFANQGVAKPHHYLRSHALASLCCYETSTAPSVISCRSSSLLKQGKQKKNNMFSVLSWYNLQFELKQRQYQSKFWGKSHLKARGKYNMKKVCRFNWKACKFCDQQQTKKYLDSLSISIYVSH